MKELNRRNFMKIIASAGLTLAVINKPFGIKILQAKEIEDSDIFVPNLWLHISKDDEIIIIVNKSEMGQGVYTSLPQIIADELGAKWENIKVFPALARKEYIDQKMGGQLTGGSSSIRHMYEPLRVAGATAREMLIMAAAKKWNVDTNACYTRDGKVFGPNKLNITFGSLVNQAKKIIPPLKPELKDRSKFQFIGKPIKRTDTYLKVTGEAIFGIDVILEDMLYATVKMPPAYGSKVRHFDVSKAKDIKGFLNAFEISDGVAIVAKSIDALLQSRDLITVEFSSGAQPNLNTKFIEETLIKHIDKDCIIARRYGKVKELLVNEENKITSTYLLPYLAHVNLEPMNCTVHKKEDRIDIWVPTQAQSSSLEVVKKITGLPEEKIFIHTTYLGTGLGRRAEVDFVIQAIEIANKVKKPVKLIWMREDDFKHDFYRPANYSKISGCLDAKGNILAWDHKIAIPSIWERIRPEAMHNGIDSAAIEGLVNLPYDVPNLNIEYVKVDLPVPVGFWRSVGSTHNAFTVESFVDELAYLSHRDPVEFRIAHLTKNRRATRLVGLVAEKIGWNNKDIGYGYGIAQHYSFGSYAAEAAKIWIDENSGKVEVKKIVAAIDCGNIINPAIIEAQIKGAIVMGLSTSFKEKMTFENGGASVDNFYNYDILRANEVPEIEVHIVESGASLGGVGEPGVPPVAPSIANAIFNATGIRLRNLPITPEYYKTEKRKKEFLYGLI
jgi:isoquinoline 1-oxidoreductase beta subunit